MQTRFTYYYNRKEVLWGNIIWLFKKSLSESAVTQGVLEHIKYTVK